MTGNKVNKKKPSTLSGKEALGTKPPKTLHLGLHSTSSPSHVSISSAMSPKPKTPDGLSVEMVPLVSIKPYFNNPRRNEAAIKAVKASIDEFGWRQAIVVDENNVIIMGHTRRLAAIERKDVLVPVHKAIGLTPEKVKALRLADNKVSEISEWDTELLAQELQELSSSDVDMSIFGFSEEDLNFGEEEENEKNQKRLEEDFTVKAIPKPQWILIKAPEEVAAEIVADLRIQEIEGVVIHYSGEGPHHAN